jgi:hypothetical protein
MLTVCGTLAMLLLARFLPKFADSAILVLSAQIFAGAFILIIIARLLAETIEHSASTG